MKYIKITSNTKRKTGFDWIVVYNNNRRHVYNVSKNKWEELYSHNNMAELPIKSLKAALRHIKKHVEIKSGYRIKLIKFKIPEEMSFEQWFKNIIVQPNKYDDVLEIEIK